MPANGNVIQAVVFIILLVAASVMDIKKRMVSDIVCLMVAFSSLLSFQTQNLWGILIALPFLLAAVTCGGMGGGDIKLIAAAGLVLGMPAGIGATILGLSLVLAYSIVFRIFKKEHINAVPMIPFLSVGCIAGYFMK
ncbi:prepilin peptidase [[Clostridium] symbiosum]|uniref:prepilin peptidase n=1 Tax=Clostridium symbiosum TaxID=1512 RepID=UPI001AA17960|nr:A24 family peptidase [[Clostridium] symbiosum]MBO1695242.1 prepilin peptidase [[Clostridium] symbiosum]